MHPRARNYHDRSIPARRRPHSQPDSPRRQRAGHLADDVRRLLQGLHGQVAPRQRPDGPARLRRVGIHRRRPPLRQTRAALHGLQLQQVPARAGLQTRPAKKRHRRLQLRCPLRRARGASDGVVPRRQRGRLHRTQQRQPLRPLRQHVRAALALPRPLHGHVRSGDAAGRSRFPRIP